MSQNIIELKLDGNVPSKKNSRVRTRSGSSIPSKAFYDWQNSALLQTKAQTRARGLSNVAVEVIIYFGTNVRADLDNRLRLVEGLVLRDDKWQDVPRLQAQGEYRKKEPGAFVRITQL